MTKTKTTAAAFTLFAATFAVLFLYLGVLQTGDEPHPDDDVRPTPQITRDPGDLFDDPSDSNQESDATTTDDSDPDADSDATGPTTLNNVDDQPAPAPTSADIEALLDLSALEPFVTLSSVQPLFTDDGTAIRGMYAQIEHSLDATLTGNYPSSASFIAWRFMDADGNELARAFSHTHVHGFPENTTISLDPLLALDTPVNREDIATILVDSHSAVARRQLVELTPTYEWREVAPGQFELHGRVVNHSDDIVVFEQVSVTLLDPEGNILHVTPGQSANGFLPRLGPDGVGGWWVPADRIPAFDTPPEVQVRAHGWVFVDPSLATAP